MARERPSILVVEDDDDLREALVERLEEEGYRVLQARNGAEALRLLDAARPGAMTLDLKMPVMSGWEVLRALESRGQDEQPAVLVASGRTPPEAEIDPHRVAGYLVKPYDGKALLSAIDRAVGG